MRPGCRLMAARMSVSLLTSLVRKGMVGPAFQEGIYTFLESGSKETSGLAPAGKSPWVYIPTEDLPAGSSL